MKKFPLLIGGAPRSGTTALIQLLNSNPAVFLSSEENLLKLAQNCKKNLSTQERRQSNLSNGMRETSIRETLNASNIHTHNFSKSSTWPVIRYIYKWHHHKLHPEATLAIWGDKLPNYYKELDTIIESGKFKYLHITRNPLDVINSMLRRTEMARQGKDWWKAVTNFDEMLSVWCLAYTAIEKYQDNPNVLHIHYEDLLFKYSETVTAINRFIEADLDYQNILMSDQSLHFDRGYLTHQQIDQIVSNSIVSHYMANRNLNAQNSFR